MTAAFDAALSAHRCWLHLDDGQRRELPVWRWHAPPDHVDELMLHRCQGPTLDVGCGPGRLTAALWERGTTALGIDTSPRAVRMTARRGGLARRQSVFERVPGEGSWRHVLLADGNLGIGGQGVPVVRRAWTTVIAGQASPVVLLRGFPGPGRPSLALAPRLLPLIRGVGGGSLRAGEPCHRSTQEGDAAGDDEHHLQ